MMMMPIAILCLYGARGWCVCINSAMRWPKTLSNNTNHINNMKYPYIDGVHCSVDIIQCVRGDGDGGGDDDDGGLQYDYTSHKSNGNIRCKQTLYSPLSGAHKNCIINKHVMCI